MKIYKDAVSLATNVSNIYNVNTSPNPSIRMVPVIEVRDDEDNITGYREPVGSVTCKNYIAEYFVNIKTGYTGATHRPKEITEDMHNNGKIILHYNFGNKRFIDFLLSRIELLEDFENKYDLGNTEVRFVEGIEHSLIISVDGKWSESNLLLSLHIQFIRLLAANFMDNVLPKNNLIDAIKFSVDLANRNLIGYNRDVNYFKYILDSIDLDHFVSNIDKVITEDTNWTGLKDSVVANKRGFYNLGIFLPLQCKGIDKVGKSVIVTVPKEVSWDGYIHDYLGIVHFAQGVSRRVIDYMTHANKTGFMWSYNYIKLLESENK